jgi:hypothetical protein
MMNLEISNGIPGPIVLTTTELLGIIVGSSLGVIIIIFIVLYCLKIRYKSRVWDYDLPNQDHN